MMRAVVALLLCFAAFAYSQPSDLLPPDPLLTIYGPPYTSEGSVSNDPTAVTVGVQFSLSVPGTITGCLVWRVTCNTYTTCRLYSSTGVSLASGTLPGPPANCQQYGGAWTYANFTTPYSATAGTSYTVGVFAPSGEYADYQYGWQQAYTNHYITVPQSGGVYHIGSTMTFPTDTYHESDYFVSPIFLPAAYVTPTPQPSLPPITIPGSSLYPGYPNEGYLPTSVSTPTNIGVKFQVDVTGNITGCVAYTQQCNPNIGYVNCTLYDATGKVLATAPFDNVPAPNCLYLYGFYSAAFSKPYPLLANTNYTVGALVPDGGYTYNVSGFATARTVGHMHVPVGGGVYVHSSTTTYPTLTSGNVGSDTNDEYMISPVFVATPGATAKPTPKPATPAPTPSSKPTPKPTPGPTLGPVQSLYAPYTQTPAIASDTSSVTVGVVLQFNVGGYVTGFEAYTNGGCGHTFAVWDFTGDAVASGSLACGSGAGWVSGSLSTPYYVDNSYNYTYGVYFPTGAYAALHDGFDSGRKVGNLVVPAGGGVFSYGSSITRPSQSYLNSEYFVTPLLRYGTCCE